MAEWNFDKDGNISDGLGNSVGFNALVKYDDGAVRDIQGNSLPIGVIDSDKLAGLAADQYVTKDSNSVETVPISKVLNNDILLNPSNLTTGVYQVLNIKYTGQQCSPYLPTIGDELLPNVTFDNTDNITAGNDANLSVSDGILSVNANTTDYPYGEESFSVTADTLYVLYINQNGTTPAFEVLDGSGNVVLEKVTTAGGVTKCIKAVADDTYTIRMYMNGTGDDDTATFTGPTIKKLYEAGLKIGDYYTYTDTDGSGIKTHIETKMTAYDFLYEDTKEYSNLKGNNIACLWDDFTVLQYIGEEAGKSGYVVDDNGDDVEHVVDNDGNWIGDFDVQADVDTWSTTGPIVKTLTDGAMELTRNTDDDNDGVLEAYVNISTEAGKKYVVGFDVVAIDAYQWDMYAGDKKVIVKYPIGNDDTIRMYISFTATDTTTKISFVCSDPDNSDSDKLTLDNVTIKELDETIWQDLTPTVAGESTTYIEHDSFMSETLSLTVNDTKHIRGNMLGKLFEQSQPSQRAHRDGSLVDYVNGQIVYGAYDGSCNRLNDIHDLQMVRFQKFKVFRTNHNQLGITFVNPYIKRNLTLYLGSGQMGHVLPTDTITKANKIKIKHQDYITTLAYSYFEMDNKTLSNNNFRVSNDISALIEPLTDSAGDVSFNENDFTVTSATNFNQLGYHNLAIVDSYGGWLEYNTVIGLNAKGSLLKSPLPIFDYATRREVTTDWLIGAIDMPSDIEWRNGGIETATRVEIDDKELVVIDPDTSSSVWDINTLWTHVEASTFNEPLYRGYVSDEYSEATTLISNGGVYLAEELEATAAGILNRINQLPAESVTGISKDQLK